MTVSGVKGWAVRRWSTAFAVPAPLEESSDEYIHKNYEYFGLTAPAALFKRS